MNVLKWPGRITLILAGLFIFWLMLIVWQLRGMAVVLLESTPSSIMGTSTTIKAAVSKPFEKRGRQAMQEAEEALRRVDSLMSIWVGTTELAQLNKAPAGKVLPLSLETLLLLKKAKELSEETGGAFDPTCTPLIELWKKAEQDDREPTPYNLAQSMEKTGWRWFVFHENGVEKKLDEASIDLGGIAKGFAVDRAITLMKGEILGGMVQCGGDLRVFGRDDKKSPWRIAIRDPFSVLEIHLPEVLTLCQDEAVSTSGNYERYYTVQGKRRSHIIDPRSGIPVDEVPQVTVIAPNATLSDGWSTALTVLGSEGFKRLPKGVEAMMIVGREGDTKVYKTTGFEKYISTH